MKNHSKNEEDDSKKEIDEYTSQIINYQIKTNLSVLISTLENQIKKTKLQFFNTIKNYNKSINDNIMNISSEKLNKQLKMYFIFHKLSS